MSVMSIGSQLNTFSVPSMDDKSNDHSSSSSSSFSSSKESLQTGVEFSHTLDSSNELSGIAKLKRSRRERHYKAIELFEKELDKITEEREGDVLRLVLSIRDALEEMDQKLSNIYKDLDSSDYLIQQQEQHLNKLLNDIHNIIKDREFIIEKLGKDLDSIESNRASILSTELKRLVDVLVNIAHQLPNEIEHIIEEEAYEFNALIIQNRLSHADLLLLLQNKHIEIDIEAKYRWEVGKKKWRQLCHDKAVKDFVNDIHSNQFFQPEDRKIYLDSFKEGQQDRHSIRQGLLNTLSTTITKLKENSISSADAIEIKEKLTIVTENEVNAIQQCYDTLQDKCKDLQSKAESRRESFRYELHLYNALVSEPDREELSMKLETILKDESYYDLWRLSGSLKSDLRYIASELNSAEIIYDKHVNGILDKLEYIQYGFSLKEVTISRGREGVIERTRNLISKLRIVPRHELPELLENLIIDLEDMTVDGKGLPLGFTQSLSVICYEIKEAITKANELQKQYEVNCLTEKLCNSPTATLTAVKASMKLKSTFSATTSPKGTMNSSRGFRTTMNNGSKSNTNNTSNSNNMNQMYTYIDPIQVKGWYKKLGVLYYSFDLPSQCKDVCIECIDAMKQQKLSNAMIDTVVSNVSTKVMNRIDTEYKQIIDNITNFLESQSMILSHISINICNYYITIAKRLELNCTRQNTIDEHSKDELWDMSEDYRIELEDLEMEFLSYCKQLIGSESEEKVGNNFTNILQVLDKIQSSYYSYHEKICYISDKYPLRIVYEYMLLLSQLSENMSMKLCPDHSIILLLQSTFDEVIKHNQKLYDMDPTSLGVNPISSNDDNNMMITMGNDHEHLYISLNAPSSNTKEKGGEQESIKGVKDSKDKLMKGKYYRIKRIDDIISTFQQENGYVLVDDLNSNLNTNVNTNTNSETTSIPISSYSTNGLMDITNKIDVSEIHPTFSIESHEIYPFLKKDCIMIPLLSSDIENMNEDDKYEYNVNISKGFIDLGDIDILIQSNQIKMNEYMNTMATNSNNNTNKSKSKSNNNSSNTNNKSENKKSEKVNTNINPNDESNISTIIPYIITWTTNPDLVELYRYTKFHIENNKISQWNRLNPTQYIDTIRISNQDIHQYYSILRNHVLPSIESEVMTRYHSSINLTDDRKHGYTEELEDRIRLHWPRRGRIETLLKQPRLAELHSHSERIYRFIQSIQSKMKSIQEKYYLILQSCQNNRKEYMKSILSYHSQIKDFNTGQILSSSFKNIATLQSIDMKVRQLNIGYNHSYEKLITEMKDILVSTSDMMSSYIHDFKKQCPMQSIEKCNNIDDIFNSNHHVGYSQYELDYIDGLLSSQSQEIEMIVNNEWKSLYDTLLLECDNTVKEYYHEKFIIDYEQCMHELSMSEGLGPKYGMPRRRAGERIRTEISRDEFASDMIDSILSQLEYISKDYVDNNVMTITENYNRYAREYLENAIKSWSLLTELRMGFIYRIQYLKVWQSNPLPNPSLPWLCDDYIPMITTFSSNSSSTSSPTTLSPSSKAIMEESNSITIVGNRIPIPVSTLEEVMNEIEQNCREETIELYSKEGGLSQTNPPSPNPSNTKTINSNSNINSNTKSGVNKQTTIKNTNNPKASPRINNTNTKNKNDKGDKNDTIPESLENWLKESHEKILGENGYREQAWKKLWSQIQRYELLIQRKQYVESMESNNEKREISDVILYDDDNNDNSTHSNKVGIIGYCMRSICNAYTIHLKNQIMKFENDFYSTIESYQSAREHNERTLRPQLGSEGAIDELNTLHDIETNRSLAYVESISNYRKNITTLLFNESKRFLSDIAICSESFLQLIDTSVRLESIQTPPNTFMPKKHMSMKKLRKVQKLRQLVSEGQREDVSTERVWPGFHMNEITSAFVSVLDYIPIGDMEKNGNNNNNNNNNNQPSPTKAGKNSNAINSKLSNTNTNNKLGPGKVTVKPSITEDDVKSNEFERKSNYLKYWAEEIERKTSIRSGVSTSHRILIRERDDVIEKYGKIVIENLENIKWKCDDMISKENNWKNVWIRQVNILRQGNL